MNERGDILDSNNNLLNYIDDILFPERGEREQVGEAEVEVIDEKKDERDS